MHEENNDIKPDLIDAVDSLLDDIEETTQSYASDKAGTDPDAQTDDEPELSTESSTETEPELDSIENAQQALDALDDVETQASELIAENTSTLLDQAESSINAQTTNSEQPEIPEAADDSGEDETDGLLTEDLLDEESTVEIPEDTTPTDEDIADPESINEEAVQEEPAIEETVDEEPASEEIENLHSPLDHEHIDESSEPENETAEHALDEIDTDDLLSSIDTLLEDVENTDLDDATSSMLDMDDEADDELDAEDAIENELGDDENLPEQTEEVSDIDELESIVENLVDDLLVDAEESSTPDQAQDDAAESAEESREEADEDPIDEVLTDTDLEEAVSDIEAAEEENTVDSAEESIDLLDDALAQAADDMLDGDFETEDGELVTGEAVASEIEEALGADGTDDFDMAMIGDATDDILDAETEDDESLIDAAANEAIDDIENATLDAEPAESPDEPAPTQQSDTQVSQKADELTEDEVHALMDPDVLSELESQEGVIPSTQQDFPAWYERAVEIVRPKLERIDPFKGKAIDAIAMAIGTIIITIQSQATPLLAKLMLIVSKPLSKQSPEIRNAVGYIALWTGFLGTVLWIYLLMFRSPHVPTPETAPSRVINSAESLIDSSITGSTPSVLP
ncbi:MAG: hypothetical protein AB8C13_05720 [Phycisphaerales bacterium]